MADAKTYLNDAEKRMNSAIEHLEDTCWQSRYPFTGRYPS